MFAVGISAKELFAIQLLSLHTLAERLSWDHLSQMGLVGEASGFAAFQPSFSPRQGLYFFLPQ